MAFFGINTTGRHESPQVYEGRVSLQVKFIQWGNESSDASGPLFQSGYFIDEPTKDALSDVLHVTVYIGFGVFNRESSCLAESWHPSPAS